MAYENRNGFIDVMGGLRRRTSRESSFEYEFRLGLKTQPTASQSESESESKSSYPSCKRTMFMLPSPSPPPHHHQNQIPSSESTAPPTNFKGRDDKATSTCTGGGGGPIFFNTTINYQLACGGSDIYDAVAAAGASVTGVGVPALSGKALFTDAQWQELERQTEICKYIMASAPVPPQLLFSPHNNLSRALGPVSQSIASALDSKFSSGTDPEPWRCRRTDGKKWRCSRDVAPHQKYCERHAHKSRPRSRKHVEVQPHSNTNYCTPQPISLLANTSSQLLQKPIAHSPTMGSVLSYDQYRGDEWFPKGNSGTTLGNQHWRQLMQSSRAEVNKNSSNHNKEECRFQHRYKDKRDTMTLIPYMDSCSAEKSENHQLNGPYCCSFLDPKAASLQGNLDAHTTQPTRHFIDAWSTSEKEGLDKINNNGLMSSGMKLPLSSLTFSIPGGNDIDDDNEHANKGFGMMMSSERNNIEEAIKSQWMNPVSWMSSAPGGPLGEALCLGVAGSAKFVSNLPSTRGYSNSTTPTSCSRNSCEDGTHGLNFIG